MPPQMFIKGFLHNLVTVRLIAGLVLAAFIKTKPFAAAQPA